MNSDNVYEAVCASYSDMPRGCVDYQGVIQGYNDDVDLTILVFVIVGLLTFNIVLILMYKNCTEKEMKNDMEMQVNSAVSQYIALSQE
jgi:hypothetical protein